MEIFIRYSPNLYENIGEYMESIYSQQYVEINCEAPIEMAEKVAARLHAIMVKAGKIFCTRCKLDADISRCKDGTLPNYWIH